MTSTSLNREAILAEQTFSAAESAVLRLVHYGARTTPSVLCEAASGEFYSPAGPVTVAECQDALASLLAKRVLQVIDEATLEEIKAELAREGFLGPIYGLPAPGDVDFTREAAQPWLPEEAPAQRSFAFTDAVHMKTACYFRRQEAALRYQEEVQNWTGVTRVAGPVAIGPWRVEWWRRYPEGCRFDFEEKYQWQGQCGGRELPHLGPAPQDREHDPRRLQRVLDCHNLALAEWLILSAIEHCQRKEAHFLPRWVAQSAKRDHGVTVSEDECRAGLEECLANGWVQVLDIAGQAAIRELLRRNPAVTTLSRAMGHWGETDFTPEGACLYQMLCAEYLGPGWDADVWVEKTYYCKEHRYCATEEGIRAALEAYPDYGDEVRSSNITPIGPWCVYWWERFPSGYRLEVEIGDPHAEAPGAVWVPVESNPPLS